MLAHLSKTNNSPARACGTVHGALREAGHGGVRVRAAIADHPTPWIEVGRRWRAPEHVYRYAREKAPATLRHRVIRRATIVASADSRAGPPTARDDYLRRLRRYFPVEVVEVAEEDMNRRSPAGGARRRGRPPPQAHPRRLPRRRPRPRSGQALSSEALSRKAELFGVSGRSHVTFVARRPSGPLAGVRAAARTSSGPSAPSRSRTPSPGSSSWSSSTGRSRSNAARSTIGRALSAPLLAVGNQPSAERLWQSGQSGPARLCEACETGDGRPSPPEMARPPDANG